MAIACARATCQHVRVVNWLLSFYCVRVLPSRQGKRRSPCFLPEVSSYQKKKGFLELPHPSMADAFWRYGDARQPPIAPPPAVGKRPRSDFDIPGAPELSGFYAQEERGAPRPIRDTEAIGASYDRYLRNGQLPSYGAGEPVRPVTGGMSGHPVDDPRMMGVGSMDPGMAAKGRSMGFGVGRPDMPLPPDASSTLYVEGLPANSTRREVSHIFRPFVGFKEVRLVSKESKHAGGDPLILCFVDFSTPSHAAIALDALQGYKFDEHDRDSAILRLQFARYPGPRSGGPRGRR